MANLAHGFETSLWRVTLGQQCRAISADQIESIFAVMKKGAVDIELSARGVEVAPPAGACPVLDQETQSLMCAVCRVLFVHAC